MPFALSKPASGNKIFFSKTDKSTPYMIFKTAFAEKLDNNDSNFELIYCSCIPGASKLFVKNNQIQESVMSLNVTESLSG